MTTCMPGGATIAEDCITTPSNSQTNLQTNLQTNTQRSNPDARVGRSAVPAMSAEDLHATALQAFRGGNRGRLALGQVLRALHESKLVRSLGYLRIDAYAERHFHFCRAQTYELMGVVTALDTLPHCMRAFGAGRLGWTAVREIRRVATPQTEETWIALARDHNVEALVAEIGPPVALGAAFRQRLARRPGLRRLDRELALRALQRTAAARGGQHNCG